MESSRRSRITEAWKPVCLLNIWRALTTTDDCVILDRCENFRRAKCVDELRQYYESYREENSPSTITKLMMVYIMAVYDATQ